MEAEERSNLLAFKGKEKLTEEQPNEEKQIEPHMDKNKMNTEMVTIEEKMSNTNKEKSNEEEGKGIKVAIQETTITKHSPHKTATKKWKIKARELGTTQNDEKDNLNLAIQKRKAHDLTSMEVNIPICKQKRMSPTVEFPTAEAARQPCRSP
ncbi:hypothetical protein PIB30_084388 [Stylosanthes scabra]|uniref:Uncharacterized protein n=1 Tax=Stylosanthes scabra TaxID=79078 RepID=A0ABU6QS33_9FABA|nr:hypothetical protein [Stylosanthes scabra]